MNEAVITQVLKSKPTEKIAKGRAEGGYGGKEFTYSLAQINSLNPEPTLSGSVDEKAKAVIDRLEEKFIDFKGKYDAKRKKIKDEFTKNHASTRKYRRAIRDTLEQSGAVAEITNNKDKMDEDTPGWSEKWVNLGIMDRIAGVRDAIEYPTSDMGKLIRESTTEQTISTGMFSRSETTVVPTFPISKELASTYDGMQTDFPDNVGAGWMDTFREKWTEGPPEDLDGNKVLNKYTEKPILLIHLKKACYPFPGQALADLGEDERELRCGEYLWELKDLTSNKYLERIREEAVRSVSSQGGGSKKRKYTKKKKRKYTKKKKRKKSSKKKSSKKKKTKSKKRYTRKNNRLLLK
jgi:hypothetical protein